MPHGPAHRPAFKGWARGRGRRGRRARLPPPPAPTQHGRVEDRVPARVDAWPRRCGADISGLLLHVPMPKGERVAAAEELNTQRSDHDDEAARERSSTYAMSWPSRRVPCSSQEAAPRADPRSRATERARRRRILTPAKAEARARATSRSPAAESSRPVNTLGGVTLPEPIVSEEAVAHRCRRRRCLVISCHPAFRDPAPFTWGACKAPDDVSSPHTGDCPSHPAQPCRYRFPIAAERETSHPLA
jgi:hypothetical protein